MSRENIDKTILPVPKCTIKFPDLSVIDIKPSQTASVRALCIETEEKPIRKYQSLFRLVRNQGRVTSPHF